MAVGSFISDKPLLCPSCDAKVDCWAMVMDALTSDVPLLGHQAFSFVGAQAVSFSIKLAPHNQAEVVFSEHGVPEHCHIVSINYTPYGAIFPLKVHGNQPLRGQHPRRVTLYGRPADSPSPEEPKVRITVTWVQRPRVYWQALIDAVEAFSLRHYDGMVIPANSFLESLTRETLAQLVQSHVPEITVEKVSYYLQINKLLPIFAKLLRIEGMPGKVREAVNKLRKRRNKLAHGNFSTLKVLRRQEAAEMLCGAIMCAGYQCYVLSRAEKKGG